MTLAPPEIRRTDLACKNPICGHAVGDHVSINFPLQGCRACMKQQRNPICVPRGAIILGDDKLIQDIEVGDHAVGMSDSLNSVLGTTSRSFNGELCLIKGTGILPFHVTDEHRLLTYRGEHHYRYVASVRGRRRYLELNGPRWVAARDLLPSCSSGKVKGDYLFLPKMSRHVGNSPVSERVAWLLGLYTAEGFPSGGDGVIFALGKHERRLIRKLVTTLESLGFEPKTHEKRTTITVAAWSRELADLLPKWCGRGAGAKRIPDFILYGERLQIEAFLSGYLSGDGAIHRPRGYRKASVMMNTVSKLLALQLQLAFARVGRFAHLRIGHPERMDIIEGRVVHSKRIFELEIFGKSKNSMVREIEHGWLVPVRSVAREHYSGKVYNLTTKDGTYLISNVATHNCDWVYDSKTGDTIPPNQAKKRSLGDFT